MSICNFVVMAVSDGSIYKKDEYFSYDEKNIKNVSEWSVVSIKMKSDEVVACDFKQYVQSYNKPITFSCSSNGYSHLDI